MFLLAVISRGMGLSFEEAGKLMGILKGGHDLNSVTNENSGNGIISVFEGQIVGVLLMALQRPHIKSAEIQSKIAFL